MITDHAPLLATQRMASEMFFVQRGWAGPDHVTNLWALDELRHCLAAAPALGS